ncbi:MAG: DUF5777 family beta-barrel protein [Ginsengibacter sp.]
MKSDSSASIKKYFNTDFKAANVINLQTTEQPSKKALQFLMMHRFGKLNDGAYNFFGLDNAVLRLSLSYGVTSNFAITIGRSSLDKAFDGSFKIRLLQQNANNSNPVSLSLSSGIVYPTIKYADKPYLTSNYRLIFNDEIIIKKQFRNFSIIISPTYIHYNLVEKIADKNDVYAIGTGAIVKLTHKMSITGEYDFLPGGQLHTDKLANSFSLGWNLATSGHIFQLVFTNSQGMTEPYFYGKTIGSWSHGDIYFGFNITRNFNL